MVSVVSGSLQKATDEEIRHGVGGAHQPTLRGLLYFLTGDDDLGKIEVTRGPGFLTSNGAYIERPEDLKMLEDKGTELLKAYRDGTRQIPDPLTIPKDRLLRSIEYMVDMPVPPSEYEYWCEEFAFDPWARELKWPDKPADKVKDFKVIVVGAGMGGINAAIQLKRAGFSYEVFERNAGVGGTWYENNYPGARVDLASRIYSHLFGINYPWKHMFATSKENSGYADWCVDNFGVRDTITFNTVVKSMHWDEAAGEWEVTVEKKDGSREVHRANGIISAGGLFDRPTIPNIPGKDDFKGEQMHTARYNTKLDMSKSKVAVVGTGASGLQMIPNLAPDVVKLTVYQRSPGWVLPLDGYREPLPESIRWLDANMPFYTNFSRVATTWLAGDHDQWHAFTTDPDWTEPNTLNRDNYVLRERAVAYIKEKMKSRPEMIDKVTPTYPPLTKRFILDNGWYDALLRDNVELETDPIDHIEADAIVTRSGNRHPTDVIIWATGYAPNAFLQPMDIRGRGGITPAEVWAKDGARAFWGVNVPGLPNFFMVYGPGTNGKISGPVPWGEMQIRYAMTCFKTLIEKKLKFMDVRTDVYDAFNEDLDNELAGSIWMDERQTSYYKNEFGRSATNSPWKVSQLWNAWKEPKLENYETA